MHIDSITDILFCAFIINREVLIFVDLQDFEVHVKCKNYNPTKYNFPIDWCLLCPQPRIQEPKRSLYFVESTNTSDNEQRYFHSQ